MTQIAKLLSKLLDGRRLTFTEFVRLMEAFGFVNIRTHGSHRIFSRRDIADQISVQPKGKEAKPYQVRQFRAIVEEYELKLDADE
ncbi:type II toxin-antitoxin system HicA family toxin [Sphingobium boeckii]|uniref:Putative RNA binding protein YcfA (HicA-like mRNA interferase family) n=1 Tax=Sphingobium boeckii TaxID=1082345 RepID=A0A7W9AIM4_9SPHN|nr:type II toxin-antitoxin system HicA family toxin [Sphingobium boeckii]MBB5686263.1 putative RNA binding protein YcfA (HicA-like mRNA interferase family) [Sphingobium boeckii]